VKAVHVEDIMTRSVVAVQSDHSIHLAAGVMQLKHIRHLPVLEGDRLVGLVTHRDLLRAQAAVLTTPYDPRHDASLTVPVTHIMRNNVWTVTPKTPVVEGGRLVGIVTEVDFMRWLVDGLTARREREDTDRVKLAP
jgi:CBS domain-containing protein